MEPTRSVHPFEVISEYKPSGDQPAAIAELAGRINAGETDVVLLGATGTGKSATTAWLIEEVQRPTLVLAHNKTLAAQLANEFRELMPNNAVEYFVSYYDYYQPEAYVPQTDTFIEKDSSINEEVERLRHSTTNSLLSRRDVIVVSTVSCIYGLGAPEQYLNAMIALQVGDKVDRDWLIRRFVSMQYQRNDVDFSRGNFRVRGDTIEIIPMYEELAIRIEMFGDEIEGLYALHPLTGDIVKKMEAVSVFPGSHYVADTNVMHRAIETIQTELHDRLAQLEREGKLLEAQRLRMRTTFDLEMMQQIGFCSGIENYSRLPRPAAATRRAVAALPVRIPALTTSLVFTDESPRHRAADRRACIAGDSSPQGDAGRITASACPVLHGQPAAEAGTSSMGPRCARNRCYLSRPRRASWEMEQSRRRLHRTGHPPHWADRPDTDRGPPSPVTRSTDLLDEVKSASPRRAIAPSSPLLTKKHGRGPDRISCTENGVRVRYMHSDIDTIESHRDS